MSFLQIKHKTLISIAFGLALLILAGIFFVTFQTEKQREVSTSWLLHTHEVLVESEQLHSLIKEAQRSQHGYLLTSDTSYLSLYTVYKDSIKGDLNHLKRFTADNQAQLARLAKIDSLKNECFNYWDHSISLHNEKGLLVAANLVKKGIGRALINEIGILIEDYKRTEEQLLQKRQDEFTTSRRKVYLMESIGASMSLLLLVASFLFLRSRLKREEQLSRMLEEMVMNRTEELQKSNVELQKSLQEFSVMNQELHRTNADLDNFVYTASHDLRSPIINLQGLLQILSKKVVDRLSPQEHEILKRMDDTTSRLNRTIKDLAEVGKIQKEELEKNQLSFEEVIQDVIQEISYLHRVENLQIQLNLEISHIRYAHTHLRSILYNLLSNAVKYRSPLRSPLVKISTKQQDEMVVLSICDNGLGLDTHQIQKLFKMFKRLHNHVEGTGIGLYMIKRIVENNQGKIEVESIPDHGTTFHVYFANQPVASLI